MSRRAASHYVLKLKLQRERELPERIADDRVRLTQMLEDGIKPAALKVAEREGMNPFGLAHAAVELACDRVLHCTLCLPSGPQDQQMLSEALRRRYALPHGAASDRLTLLTPRLLVVHWPDWLVALFDLLCLTRRSWTYLRLFTARIAGADWPDHLAQLVWDVPTKPGGLLEKLAEWVWGRRTLRDRLLAELAELEVVGRELDFAYNAAADRAAERPASKARDAVRGGATDEVEKLLGKAGPDFVEQIPAGSSAGVKGLDILWGNWPRTLPRKSFHPHLLAALADLQDLVERAGRAAVATAWLELWDEVRRPATPASVQNNLAGVLGKLKAKPDESVPADVLTAIGSVEPQMPASPINVPPEGIMPLEVLQAGLLRHASQRPPNWCALLKYIVDQLLDGKSFDDIGSARTLGELQPTNLDEQLLELMEQRLRGWHQVVSLSATISSACESWEIPLMLQADPHALSEAVQQVGSWLESPSNRAESWSVLPGETADAIIAAVLSVCLDVLSQAMVDCYREHHEAKRHVP